MENPGKPSEQKTAAAVRLRNAECGLWTVECGGPWRVLRKGENHRLVDLGGCDHEPGRTVALGEIRPETPSNMWVVNWSLVWDERPNDDLDPLDSGGRRRADDCGAHFPFLVVSGETGEEQARPRMYRAVGM